MRREDKRLCVVKESIARITLLNASVGTSISYVARKRKKGWAESKTIFGYIWAICNSGSAAAD